MAAINAFVDEKLKTTKVYIDPIFADCDFSREGWKKAVSQAAE